MENALGAKCTVLPNTNTICIYKVPITKSENIISEENTLNMETFYKNCTKNAITNTKQIELYWSHNWDIFVLTADIHSMFPQRHKKYKMVTWPLVLTRSVFLHRLLLITFFCLLSWRSSVILAFLFDTLRLTLKLLSGCLFSFSHFLHYMLKPNYMTDPSLQPTVLHQKEYS